MRSLLFSLLAVALTAPAYTQTTVPAAPSVTAGAEFKGLRFDWTAIAGAAWYQFEYRAHQTGAFVQQGANHPASTTSVRFRLPLHLFDWTHARYRVAACNSAGCTRSSEVSVSDLRRDAVGYFKASQSLIGIRFGADTDISPDGLNFVAAAPGDFITSGDSTRAGGAIYVFRRQSNGNWVQRARLTPSIPPFIEGLNEMHVAISADGNTVVLGMPNYFRQQADEQSGEVFVFRFNGTSWIRTRLLAGDRGRFGRWVAINDTGDTIATPYGEQEFEDRPHRVAIYKLLNGAWQPVRGIADRAGHREFCGEGVLSRDGSTVAETCAEQPPGTLDDRTYVRTHSGANWTMREDFELEIPGEGETLLATNLAIDATGNTIAAQMRQFPNFEFLGGLAEVQVFTRTGGAYSKVATFKPGAWRNPQDQALFGSGLALSGDGGTIAVGDVRDNGFGTGPRAAPLNPDTRALGAVYVYRLRGSWVLANMVKPNVRGPVNEFFGREIALNGNGQTLIVGNADESSSAVGIGGDWSNRDGNGAGSGAVFMY
jgi:hypothetical protein